MLNTKMSTLTKFEYAYRDASNYKAHGHILLEGTLSIEERDEVISRLDGGKFFIAEQVQVPSLYEALYEFSGGPTADDHCWHEFVQVSDHQNSVNDDHVWGATERLISKFRSVGEWDLRLSPHFSIA